MLGERLLPTTGQKLPSAHTWNRLLERISARSKTPTTSATKPSKMQNQPPPNPPHRVPALEDDAQYDRFVSIPHWSVIWGRRQAAMRGTVSPLLMAMFLLIVRQQQPPSTRPDSVRLPDLYTDYMQAETAQGNTPRHPEHILLRDMITTLTHQGYQQLLRDALDYVFFTPARSDGGSVYRNVVRLIESAESVHHRAWRDFQVRDLDDLEDLHLLSTSDDGTQESPPRSDSSGNSKPPSPLRPFPLVPAARLCDRCRGRHLQGMSCLPA